MLPRILASIALLLSILFLPYYISLILAFAGVIYFSFFWEVIFLFFLSDLLYGVKEVHLFNTTIIFVFLAILLLIIVEFFKKSTRMNP